MALSNTVKVAAISGLFTLVVAIITLGPWLTEDKNNRQNERAGWKSISDPLPGAITKSGLSVEIVDFVQIPASSRSNISARISLLKSAENHSGRLFVNDLRGKLHLNAQAILTLDLQVIVRKTNHAHQAERR